jgi:hypothetical protein
MATDIPGTRQRSLIVGTLGSLAEESPRLKICVSARPAGAGTGGPLNWFAVWSLLPLDDTLARHLLSVLTGSQEPEVERQLAVAPHLGSLTGNPLLLRLLSLYSARNRLELPASRVQLFEDLVDAILAREQKAAARPISVMTLHRGHEIAAETMARAGTSALPLYELASALARDPHGASPKMIAACSCA